MSELDREKNILLLLKDKGIAREAAAALSAAGFDVRTAESIEDTERLSSAEGRKGLVLTDSGVLAANEECRRERATLEKYFKLSLDLLCIADLQGNFQRLNPEWKRAIGYTVEELLKINFLDLVHPDDLGSTLAAIGELKENNEVKGFTNRYRTKAGDYRWLTWRSFPQDDLIYAAAHDITERVEAEQERERIAGLNEDALDAAKMAYWEFDVGTADFRFNERFYRLHGITDYRGPVMPGVDFRKYIFPEDSKKVEAVMAQAVGSDLPFLQSQIENRAIRSDGSVLWINTWFRVQKNASGKAEKIFGVNQDITDRKKTEQYLDEALKEKQMLLSELQHRAKNTFAMIASLVSLEEGRYEHPDTREALSALRGRIASLAVLYDQLYRTGGGGQVALDKYFETIVRSIEESLGNEPKSIRWLLSLEKIELTLKGATQLGLVVNELLTNALKYAFPGEKTGSIRVILRRAASGLEVLVTDDGIGLPPGFDARKSTGLGLELVRALADQLGGVFSISGGSEGTEAKLVFPEPE